MNEKQFKRLAEIVLTQRLIVCSVQRTLRGVYEEATKADSQNENVLSIIADYDRLETILKEIETVSDPADRKLFGLD